MKKITTLIISSYLAFATPGFSNSYVFIGANGNFIKSHHNKTRLTIIGSENEQGHRDQNVKSSKLSPGFTFGYQKQLHKLWYELAYEYTHDRLKKTKRWDTFKIDGLRYTRDTSIKFRHHYTHSLNAKVGFNLANNFNAYIKFAVLKGRFELDFVRHGYKTSKHRYGVAPGIGIEKKLNENLLCRLEYNYRVFNNIHTKQSYIKSPLMGPTQYNQKIKPKEHHIGLSLIYRFNLS